MLKTHVKLATHMLEDLHFDIIYCGASTQDVPVFVSTPSLIIYEYPQILLVPCSWTIFFFFRVHYSTLVLYSLHAL